jgi:hypothetical protein
MVDATKLKYKRKCQFISKCPCATGWCMNRDPDPNCIKLLISAYHNATDSRFTIFDDGEGVN